MGALRQNGKRAPRSMGTLFLPLVCPHGSNWCLQSGPPKTFKTFIFLGVLMILGVPLEHRKTRRPKMDQPKWTPKSSHGDCAKYSFFQQILNILFFGSRSLANLLSPSFFKNHKKTIIFITFRTPSLRPCWTTHCNIKN